MGDFSKEIRAYAVKNAIEFGSTDASRILPKLFPHGLEKKDIGKIIEEIKKIVKEVNSFSKEKLIEENKKYGKYTKEREHSETHELPELENVGKKMVFRLAPFPSGALHVGNAKTYLLNALYADKYNGNIILVMDDTIGSEEKQIVKEAYKLIEDGFKWLGIKYDKVYYKSDRLDLYYKYALELIQKGKAYVCLCKQETLRENREKGIECKHRKLDIKKQSVLWEEMLKMKEGGAVLRIKTDMKHPNPAFRDRVLFKISDREHPRIGKKYRVWPSLEMSWAVDDHELGITHIIRGNDLMIETDMEKYIWDIFRWKHPFVMHTGLVDIEGIEAKISKSKAQKEVKSGEFSGWDDPRTWSMQSLQRRGIRAEAVKQFVKEIGVTNHDVRIPIENLYSINRKLIDKDAERYYFVPDEIELNVLKAPVIFEVEVPIHPDKPKNIRVMRVTLGRVWISKKDFTELKNKEVRLLHLCNIKLGKKPVYTSLENKNIPKITWVSFGSPVNVLMPDGKIVHGLADESVMNVKPEEVVQFERFGFCRLDKKKKIRGKDSYEFWFAHK